MKLSEKFYRQVAGAVARRIINYAEEGSKVIQGDDAGFIKFGSRVDLFLPLDTKIDIKLNDKVKGGVQKLLIKIRDQLNFSLLNLSFL